MQWFNKLFCILTLQHEKWLERTTLKVYCPHCNWHSGGPVHE